MIRMAESLAHSPTLAASTGQGDEPPLAAGTLAGEYVVERFVGAGAMGEVYAGHHPVLGKKVAIKVLRRELATSAEAVERFTREARAVNKIEHAGVIDVFAHGRLGDGRLYLVMSFVAGATLRAKLVARGALPIADAIALLAPIADALDAAHAAGVVHRDLKPDNIMVSDGGRVFVLDFGIAKLAAPNATGPGTLTGRGTWLGTPAYMAPEQWSSDGASAASDRYALGVIAYELLAGAHPFTATSVPAMMEQHFRASPPPLLPGAVDDVLARALAKDPDARWPSAREFVDALQGAAGSSASPARAGSHASRSRSYVAPVLGVTVLALAIGIAIFLRRSPAHEQAPAASSMPPPNTVALAITTTPEGALVTLDQQLAGVAPITLHVAKGAKLDLRVAKPGYVIDHRTLAAGDSDSAMALQLGAVVRFEGVWRLPNGELRAFARTGDRVDVSKLEAVTGPRTFFRHYSFVDAPTGIAFADDEEVVDPRAPDDPACHQPVHVVYRYDAQHDTLVLDRPTVDVDFVAGHCVEHGQRTETVELVRVDGTRDAPEELPAPVGVPIKKQSVTKVSKKPIASRKSTAKSDNNELDLGAKNASSEKVNGQIVPPPQPSYPVQQSLPQANQQQQAN
jgi:tRNA A-37 threonylcarbamoyl transferase component Bud32